MDTIAMFIFGAVLAILFVLWLAKALYDKVQARRRSSKSKVEPLVNKSEVIGTDAVDAIKKPQPIIAPKAAGGYVPPTPPVRKRLTRQSPVPEVRKPRFVAAPSCTGPDNVVVLWVNETLQWLFNDLVVVNELLGVWIQSINEFTKKSVLEQGIGVELIRILPETHTPTFTNIFAEADSKEDVTITCDCDMTPAFQLKAFRQKGEKVETCHYRVNVNRFRARLNIYCVTEKLQAEVKCDGWPEIKIALAPVGNIKNNLDETQLQEVISEILTNAFRSTDVKLNLAQYSSCPKLIRHVEMPPGRGLPAYYDSMTNAYTSTPNHNAYNSSNLLQGEKRLLVKILRASELSTHDAIEPFCVVEMDEPPQKNQTSVQRGTREPFWDEHFLFDLTPHTAELLFEIYDHATKPHKFLGLAIVGVEELLVNPSQRQIILLQSRPYESDPVSGTLTVEFSFIEGADIPNLSSSQPYKIKEAIRTPSPNRSRPMVSNSRLHNDGLTNGNHLVNSGLHNLENSRNMSSANNNTLIVHSIQRQPSQRLVKVELANGTWKELERIELNDEKSTEKTDDYGKEATGVNGNASSKAIDSEKKPADFSKIDTFQSHMTPGTEQVDFRGRPRKRRDFFGTIKRRLGKSRNRSKSAGPENDIGRDDSLNRSVSADRGRNNHVDGYQLNVPLGGSTEQTSRRSSLSEASGLSSASMRTYINEASTLVLETVENGIQKHYLVPLSIAQKSRWKKKGVKLHIYNDHTFVAKHLQGGSVCQVCTKGILRRFGKQGYECRDCFLKCHKPCHVKVNDNCPQSSIHNIELSYMQPLTDKNVSVF